MGNKPEVRANVHIIMYLTPKRHEPTEQDAEEVVRAALERYLKTFSEEPEFKCFDVKVVSVHHLNLSGEPGVTRPAVNPTVPAPADLR